MSIPFTRAAEPLTHVVPVAPVAGRIPEALDCRLGVLARSAQGGDAAARDAVYAALAPRLDIVVRAVYRRCHERVGDPAVELDDLRQEGYLILVDLIDRWDGDTTVCEHVLSRFHWRLRAAYVALGGSGSAATGTGRPVDLTEIIGAGSIDEVDASEASPLRLLTEGLPERQRTILRLIVGGGYRQWQVAKALGIGRSTLTREWDRALATLRETLRVS